MLENKNKCGSPTCICNMPAERIKHGLVEYADTASAYKAAELQSAMYRAPEEWARLEQEGYTVKRKVPENEKPFVVDEPFIGIDMADTADATALVSESILLEAERLVSGDRRQDYGHPADNFRDVAAMWSVILDKEIKPSQVINCMIALKLCRAKQSGWKRDTYVDIAGYAKCRQLVEEANDY
jgi:Domain of unknown function (DUF6378)